ncbi:MAG: hypothetical protein JJ938_00185 [Roseicyclus sp.]|nr:hypothetical protein [Roseicyclus sp.]MBO6623261.1 hypothetical protein [Roseicyclus sp.]MBO6922108.1 hypothetical protein [Roseicyclus sp.]
MRQHLVAVLDPARVEEVDDKGVQQRAMRALVARQVFVGKVDGILKTAVIQKRRGKMQDPYIGQRLVEIVRRGKFFQRDGEGRETGQIGNVLRPRTGEVFRRGKTGKKIRRGAAECRADAAMISVIA